jgi:hypothetical protein
MCSHLLQVLNTKFSREPFVLASQQFLHPLLSRLSPSPPQHMGSRSNGLPLSQTLSLQETYPRSTREPTLPALVALDEVSRPLIVNSSSPITSRVLAQMLRRSGLFKPRSPRTGSSATTGSPYQSRSARTVRRKFWTRNNVNEYSLHRSHFQVPRVRASLPINHRRRGGLSLDLATVQTSHIQPLVSQT